jgi:uncharacterized protein (TIGR03435 family)
VMTNRLLRSIAAVAITIAPTLSAQTPRAADTIEPSQYKRAVIRAHNADDHASPGGFMRSFVGAAVVVSSVALVASQQESRFDVASVKPDQSGETGIFIRMDGETFTANRITLRELVSAAYNNNYRGDEIIGGPSWSGANRFAITARRSGAVASNEMLRNLLADRFGLRTHTEMREVPVYELVVARADGALGPKLTRSTANCGVERCSGRNTGAGFVGTGIPLGLFIGSTLQGAAGRRVIDRTGLTGSMDIDVRWDPQGLGRSPIGVEVPTGATDSGSVFTAVQEQLGLRLRPSRQMRQVLIIDSATFPEPD